MKARNKALEKKKDLLEARRVKMLTDWQSNDQSGQLQPIFGEYPGLGRFADNPIKDLTNDSSAINPFDQKMSNQIFALLNSGLKEVLSNALRVMINQVFDQYPTESMINELESRLKNLKTIVCDAFRSLAKAKLKNPLKAYCEATHLNIDERRKIIEKPMKEFVQICELAVEPYLQKDKTEVVKALNANTDIIQIYEDIEEIYQSLTSINPIQIHPAEIKFDLLKIEDLQKKLDELKNKGNHLSGNIQKRRNKMFDDARKKLTDLFAEPVLEGELFNRQINNFYLRIERYDKLLRKCLKSPLFSQPRKLKEKEENELKEERKIESKEGEKVEPQILILRNLANGLKVRWSCHQDPLSEIFDTCKNIIADLKGAIQKIDWEIAVINAEIQANNTCWMRWCHAKALEATLVKFVPKLEKLKLVRNSLCTIIDKHSRFDSCKITPTGSILRPMLHLMDSKYIHSKSEISEKKENPSSKYKM